MLDNSELKVAEDYYLQGDFELATEAYLGLSDSNSPNPKLLVNKAVCEFKQGNYGASLADLYRAKKLIPRDSRLNTNIELVQDELNLDQPNLSFLNYFTVNELLIALLVTNIFFVFRWRLTKSKIMRFFISFVFVIVFIVSTYSYINQKILNYAVVQSSSMKVYSGNNDSFSEIGELLEGQIVNVKSRHRGWSQISYNDQLGWVQEDNLGYF
jgi:tetratricopeptide (TPR) repeat protein